MPTYDWVCPDEHRWEQWLSIHDAAVATCPECDAPGVKVFAPPMISVNATPNKGADVRAIDAKERRWDHDMPEYKTLRHQGFQPRSIDGCDELGAKAKDPLEVAMGRVWKNDEQRSVARDCQAELRENNTAEIVQQLGEISRRTPRKKKIPTQGAK